MKIIAVLESSITGGGAFNQALNAIIQMRRVCKGRFDFEVFSLHAENTQQLQKLGINCIRINYSLIDKLIVGLANKSWWRRIQRRLKLTGKFERMLMRHKCDLVYFLTQSPSMDMLQRTNFITTVFDLCHRDTPEFPEVREFGEFQSRESHFNNNLSYASIIITESEKLSDSLSRRYGVDRDRCLAMPMAISPYLEEEFSIERSKVLSSYELQEGYFFYPAQFWAHKNHIRILEALVQLRSEGLVYRLVFAGADKGNRSYIERFVSRNNLAEQVRFLGFVPAEYMRGLYEGSAGVIMPTYFGPTNLPPLEAWFLGKPLIYSSLLQEHSGKAAISVNPDDVNELAEAMKQCESNDEAMAILVKHGASRLSEIEKQRDTSEQELINRLLQFEIRRKCWE